MGSSGSATTTQQVDPDFKNRHLDLYGDVLRFQQQTPYQPYSGPMVAGPTTTYQAGSNYLMNALTGQQGYGATMNWNPIINSQPTPGGAWGNPYGAYQPTSAPQPQQPQPQPQQPGAQQPIPSPTYNPTGVDPQAGGQPGDPWYIPGALSPYGDPQTAFNPQDTWMTFSNMQKALNAGDLGAAQTYWDALGDYGRGEYLDSTPQDFLGRMYGLPRDIESATQPFKDAYLARQNANAATGGRLNVDAVRSSLTQADPYVGSLFDYHMEQGRSQQHAANLALDKLAESNPQLADQYRMKLSGQPQATTQSAQMNPLMAPTLTIDTSRLEDRDEPGQFDENPDRPRGDDPNNPNNPQPDNPGGGTNPYVPGGGNVPGLPGIPQQSPIYGTSAPGSLGAGVGQSQLSSAADFAQQSMGYNPFMLERPELMNAPTANATSAAFGPLVNPMNVQAQQVQAPYAGFTGAQASGVGAGQVGGAGVGADANQLNALTRGNVRDVAAQGFGDLGSYMNPYTDSVVDSTISDLNKARELAENETSSFLAGNNAFGNSRGGILTAQNNDNFLRNVARTSAQLRSAGFDTAAGLQQADANRRLQADSANQGADQQILGQALGLAGQFGQNNADRSLQAGMLNANLATNTSQFNADQFNNQSRFNAGNQLAAGMANADRSLQAGMSNQSAGLNAGLANQGMISSLNQFNAGQANNMAQFNAGNQFGAQENWQNRLLQAGSANQNANLSGQNARLNAAGMLGGFGTQMQTNALNAGSALMGLGERERLMNQAVIDANRVAQLDPREQAFRDFAFRQSILSGMPYDISTVQPGGSRGAGVLGGAATGAGIGSMIPGLGTALGAGIGGVLGLF